MAKLKLTRNTTWQIRDRNVEIGDILEIDGQVFEVIDAVRFPSKRRTGMTTNRITLQGTCAAPGCRRRYTFEVNKTQIRPLRTCPAHRGTMKTRHRGRSARAPVGGPKPKLTALKLTAPKPLPFNVGDVVYHLRFGFGDIDRTRNSIGLLRVRFDGGEIAWVVPEELTKIDPVHFAEGGAA